MLRNVAPVGQPCDYDLQHLAIYAALLDAADAEQDWREAAVRLMGIDANGPDARTCWQSHLDRARWIIGEGLASAIEVFGRHEL